MLRMCVEIMMQNRVPWLQVRPCIRVRRNAVNTLDADCFRDRVCICSLASCAAFFSGGAAAAGKPKAYSPEEKAMHGVTQVEVSIGELEGQLEGATERSQALVHPWSLTLSRCCRTELLLI